jgi:signal transduction histidine kinase
MPTTVRLVHTTGMLRSLDGAPKARGAETTRELVKLSAQLQTEARAREAAEAQLRRARKMEALGQLTGGVAHDFANMLTAIMGNLEIARQHLAQGRTDIADLLDKAIDGGNRAAGLTQRLLAFSRNQSLAPVVVDVNALVSGVAELIRATLGGTIALECVCADGLWPACVDPCQLENAVLNLAVNARDAMPDGGRLTIETHNADLHDASANARVEVPAGQYVAVTVTDTGTGMPPEVVARAFDPFFTTKPEGQGTGLGLSQVNIFVRHSQGYVQIHSEPGHGTSLTIYLPRHTHGAAVSDTSSELAAKASRLSSLW